MGNILMSTGNKKGIRAISKLPVISISLMRDLESNIPDK